MTPPPSGRRQFAGPRDADRATSLDSELATLMRMRLLGPERCVFITGLIALSGAAASIAICWMAARDLSVPGGMPVGLIGRGPYFEESAALRLYRSLIPDWARADESYDLDRLKSLEAVPVDEDGEHTPAAAGAGSHDPRCAAGYFVAGGNLVRFEVGAGLFDRIVLTRSGDIGSEEGMTDPLAIESWRKTLALELDREVIERVEFEVRPPVSELLGSFGFGNEPRHWGASALWRLAPIPAGLHSSRPVPTQPERLEPDSQIARAIERGVTARQVSETRLYGWPLRCMIVHGVRVQRWESADDISGQTVTVLQDDHWTDALVDFEHHSNWSFDADQPPATGLPWKPLWLPFLANSLILGVPLTLAGVGVSRAARAGLAKFRGRGDRCPRCGYSRKGLARDAACPECGGA